MSAKLEALSHNLQKHLGDRVKSLKIALGEVTIEVHAADYLKQKLGIDFNETTADGRFTLKEGECMGACGDAPVILANNKRMHCFMTPEEIDKLLEECK